MNEDLYKLRIINNMALTQKLKTFLSLQLLVTCMHILPEIFTFRLVLFFLILSTKRRLTVFLKINCVQKKESQNYFLGNY